MHASRALPVVVAVPLLAFLLTLSACSPSGAGTKEVPERESDVIRVATFKIDGLSEDAEDEDRERLEVLAKAIALADADILALQDVGSRDAVERFRDEFLSDSGYRFVASLDVGHPKGAENAVLSRFPITDAKVWPTMTLEGEHPPTVHGERNPHRGEPLRFRCSPLRVVVSVEREGLPAADLVLFNLDHKGGDKYRYWREAEADVISRLAEEAARTERTIVLGSFHDERGSKTVDAYLDRGFSDVFRGHGDSARVVTEASGDRTDLILVSETLQDAVEEEGSFVVGDAAAQELEILKRFPVVVALRLGN